MPPQTARPPPAGIATGIHHIALWARSRREVDRFHDQFLHKEGVTVTDPPGEYPIYASGYYAVFFVDPTGIRWELARTPRVPRLRDVFKTLPMARELARGQPEWRHHPAREMMRRLPPAPIETRTVAGHPPARPGRVPVGRLNAPGRWKRQNIIAKGGPAGEKWAGIHLQILSDRVPCGSRSGDGVVVTSAPVWESVIIYPACARQGYASGKTASAVAGIRP